MTTIDVTIMGQSYRLACKEGEELALKLPPEPTGLFCVVGAPALFATQGAQLK